jgi:hypothetical protein
LNILGLQQEHHPQLQYAKYSASMQHQLTVTLVIALRKTNNVGGASQ